MFTPCKISEQTEIKGIMDAVNNDINHTLNVDFLITKTANIKKINNINSYFKTELSP